jgi:hypothetical protein
MFVEAPLKFRLRTKPPWLLNTCIYPFSKGIPILNTKDSVVGLGYKVTESEMSDVTVTFLSSDWQAAS